MSTVQVVEIDATGPELGAAAVLFDRYRSFYGRPSNPSLAEHYLRERLAAECPQVRLGQALPASDSTFGRSVQRQAAPYSGRSGFRLLPNSNEAFRARAELIRNAQTSLDLQYYIVHDGISTRILVSELLNAADRGVRVRILLDDTTSDGLDQIIAHNRSAGRLSFSLDLAGPVADADVVFIAVLGITDQSAGKNPQRCAATGPAATFEGAKATTDQPANKAADRPRTLIEGCSAIAVSGATGEQAA